MIKKKKKNTRITDVCVFLFLLIPLHVWVCIFVITSWQLFMCSAVLQVVNYWLHFSGWSYAVVQCLRCTLHIVWDHVYHHWYQVSASPLLFYVYIFIVYNDIVRNCVFIVHNASPFPFGVTTLINQFLNVNHKSGAGWMRVRCVLYTYLLFL